MSLLLLSSLAFAGVCPTGSPLYVSGLVVQADDRPMARDGDERASRNVRVNNLDEGTYYVYLVEGDTVTEVTVGRPIDFHGPYSIAMLVAARHRQTQDTIRGIAAMSFRNYNPCFMPFGNVWAVVFDTTPQEFVR